MTPARAGTTIATAVQQLRPEDDPRSRGDDERPSPTQGADEG